MLRVTESAQKNVGGAPIMNRKYSTCCVGGTPRINAHLICRLSREMKQYPESELTEDGRITNHNKHMSWCSTKAFGHYHRNFILPLPKTGTLP